MVFAGSLLFFWPALAYEPESTHAALTEQTVEFYNAFAPQDCKISVSEKELVVKGAIEEDTAPRWIHHFYDPVHNRGWQGNLTAKAWARSEDQGAVAILTGLGMRKVIPRDGAGRPINDFSWQRGIRDHLEGRRARSLEALGHVLHLIQDMSVPEHARNDTHVSARDTFGILRHSGSPYEEWAARFRRQNLALAEQLRSQGATPIRRDDLDAYFDHVAAYANAHFFSQDTIVSPEYPRPVIRSEGMERNSRNRLIRYGYGPDEEGTMFKLVVFLGRPDWRNVLQKTFYSLDDDDLLTDYWSRLSRIAVLNGAGVINRYLAEIERGASQARQRQTQEAANSSKKSWLAGAWKTVSDFFGNAEQAARLAAIPVPFAPPTATPTAPRPSGQPPPSQNLPEITVRKANRGANVAMATSSPAPPRFATQNQEAAPAGRDSAVSPNRDARAATQLQTDAASANRAAAAVPQNASPPPLAGARPVNATTAIAPTTMATVSPPAAPSPATHGSILPAPSIAPAATSSPTPAPTPAPSYAATPAPSTTPAATAASPTPSPTPVPTTSMMPTASPSQSARPTPTPAPSPVPPNPRPSDFDFALEPRAVTSSRIALRWHATSADATFDVGMRSNLLEAPEGGEWDALLAATTASGFVFLAARDDTRYHFRVRARDRSGNLTSWKERSADYSQRPIAISEVAWMGTGTSSRMVADEWIELHNKTRATLSVSGWRIFEPSTGFPALNVQLGGKISPHGYYLLERGSDEVIRDVDADLIYTGFLRNDGMALHLEDANGRLMDTLPHSGLWAAGDNQTKATMERINPSLPGDIRENWFTNTGRVKNGHNAEGHEIRGTPKAQNSVHRIYHAVSQKELNAERVRWQRQESPYLLPAIFGGELTVKGLLEIESGAVVKLAPGARLGVEGAIRAGGTERAPVVFTSYHDDAHGGDTNQDGTRTVPDRGVYWQAITIRSQSRGSELINAIFRYGGLPPPSAWTVAPAMVVVEETAATITQSTFEHGFWNGLRLSGAASSTIVANSDFRNFTEVRYNSCNLSSGSGLVVLGGTPVIRGSRFKDSIYGISVCNGGRPVVERNSFENISITGVLNDSSLGGLSGNRMATSVRQGIVVRGYLGADATFKKDVAPYVVEQLSTGPAATLRIEPGVIIKFASNIHEVSIGGALRAEGKAAEPVIFTSLYDDLYGGDTDGSGTSTVAVPGFWRSITLAPSSSAVFRHVKLRYGGSRGAALSIGQGRSLAMEHVVIEENKGIGVLINSTTSDIAHAIFSKNEVGLALADSAVSITDALFQDNVFGIQAISTSRILTRDVRFTRNRHDTIPADLLR